MDFPGPSGFPWALLLLGYGALVGLTGEAIRIVFERRVAFFRPPDWIERTVLDVYLGVGALYVVSALPFGLSYPETPIVLAAVVSAIAIVVRLRRRARGTTPVPPAARFRWPHYLAVGAALLLFGVELATADSASAGNTYDAALYAMYAGLLAHSHTLPWNLSPTLAVANAFPQGSTAVFGPGLSLLGVPAPRLSLLLTPLFLALAPLGAFVWGRRWLGSSEAGAVFALVAALLGTWTRTLVGGSNDLVLAFPLVLLLLGWSMRWWEPGLIDLPDVVAFGGLTAICAVLNPVGPTWLLLFLPLGALLFQPRFSGRPGAWLSRWGVAVGTSILLLLPSLVALAVGPSPSTVGYPAPGAAPPPNALSAFVGYVNPFLFGPNDQLLSPFPILRAELAVLLTAGVLLLLFFRYLPADRVRARRFGLATLAATTAAIILLAIETFSGLLGIPALRGLTNPPELAILLFVVYTALASYPLVLLLARPVRPAPAPAATRSVRIRAARGGQSSAMPAPLRALLPALLAAFLLAPAVAVTAVSLPPALTQTYATFGNLTRDDFDLLSWAATNLPAGARLLVAPGGAGQFLPGYDPALVVVFPVLVVGESKNASYRVVVDELSNATLDNAGVRALRTLEVGYIVVTQRNTALWAPFEPGPLEINPASPVLFHEGDAWVFAWEAG